MNTTIGLDEKTSLKIDSWKKKKNISKGKVISKMLQYFEKNGIDPFDDEVASKEIAKVSKRQEQVIAFIKNQEKEILFPVAKEIQILKETTEKLQSKYSDLDDKIVKLFALMGDNWHLSLNEIIKEQRERFEEQNKKIDMLVKALEDENN